MQTDQLIQRLFRNERGIRYTFSTPEELLPTILRALDISLFPASEIDDRILRAVGPGTYPLVYTHRFCEFSFPISCSDVPGFLEQFGRHVSRTVSMVAFLKREEHRRLPHIFKRLFPTREMHSRHLNNRVVEYMLDFHAGESWMQVDMCHKPLAYNRFAA